MKRTTAFLVFFLSISFILRAQVAPTIYYIQFTDKHNSPYTLSAPLDFVSQKSIDRRLNQGLLLDSTDLPVNPSYIDSVLTTGNITLLNTTKWLNGITIQTTDTQALALINSFSFVQSLKSLVYKYDFVREVDKFSDNVLPLNQSSQNKKTKSQKGIHTYNYGQSYNQAEMISIDFLHNQGFNGDGMTIAVIDAGFYRVDSLIAFDSIRNNGQILGVKDFVVAGGNVYDSHTHGMMVLSLMGGHVPGQIVGTSPGASFWLLRSEDAATEYLIEEYNWVSAAEFADSVGADIINSSLGYSEFDDSTQNHVFADLDGNTTVVSRGANVAAAKGILVVNSAGNSAQSPWQRIIAPADAEGVLTVGSVNFDQYYSSFSSVGPSADGRVKPDVAAQGEGAIVAGTQNSVISGNGTSFSSPIIAGAAACLWQANPNANNWQLMQAIKESAHQFNTPDSLLGYGIPNFSIAHMLLSGVNIKTSDDEKNLLLFPNPFEFGFNIAYFSEDAHTVSLAVFDIKGKMVYMKESVSVSKGYNIISVSDLSHFSSGVYLIKIQLPNKVHTQKIMKSL